MHIQTLQLFTNKLQLLKEFYGKDLGFELTFDSNFAFSIKAGHSLLHFKQSDQPAYYHFAFNIPSFQINEALNWLRERVSILKDEGHEIIDFANWNAEAIYFMDPAGNIVEFIARKNLKINGINPFGIQNLIGISEIGLPVASVEKSFHQLKDQFQNDLNKYGSFNNKSFHAVGDENGLFIIVDQSTKSWYPTNLPAKAFPLEINFSIKEKDYLLHFDTEIHISEANDHE